MFHSCLKHILLKLYYTGHTIHAVTGKIFILKWSIRKYFIVNSYPSDLIDKQIRNTKDVDNKDVRYITLPFLAHFTCQLRSIFLQVLRKHVPDVKLCSYLSIKTLLVLCLRLRILCLLFCVQMSSFVFNVRAVCHGISPVPAVIVKFE